MLAGSFIVSVVGANGICHRIDVGAVVFICICWPFRNAALRRRGVVLPRSVSAAIGCVWYSYFVGDCGHPGSDAPNVLHNVLLGVIL